MIHYIDQIKDIDSILIYDIMCTSGQLNDSGIMDFESMLISHTKSSKQDRNLDFYFPSNN